MRQGKTLLLVDAGEQSLHVLASRLQRLGHRVVRAKTTEEAHRVLVDPRFAVAAIVIPPDLPAMDLGGAVAALRRLAAVEPVPLLVSGARPFTERRRALGRAGVSIALWEPIDAHTLRFQVNRALAGENPRAGQRRALRAAASWRVDVRCGGRRKEARVYTVSARGAFLATPAPALRRTQAELAIPLPSGAVTAAGSVVMTNVPGNLMKRNLPAGMGIRFERTSSEVEALLHLYAEERLRALEV